MRKYVAAHFLISTLFAGYLGAEEKPSAKTAPESPQQEYLEIYMADGSAEQGMNPEQKQAYEDQHVRDMYRKLQDLQKKYPSFEPALVQRRLKFLHDQVAEMDAKAAAAEAAAEAAMTPAQLYLAAYQKIQKAEHFAKDHQWANAQATYRAASDKLKALQQRLPDWETSLLYLREADCQVQINRMDQKIAAAAGQPAPVPVAVEKRTPTDYPWRKDIPTTLFWIGQNGAAGSAWDPDWTANNGGEDSPDHRDGFTTAGRAGHLNPFYVALPFNDLAYPDKAAKFVPNDWPRAAQNGKPVSACKDRWVWMKNAEGRSCFAQWEDVGPSDKSDANDKGDDHAEYVFGDEPLNPPTKPGLAISPAVAKYLGQGTDGAAPVVSWRFVDDQDVLPGQWMKYEEQAVLYLAMQGK
jgi:hypothetical protein